MNGPCRCSHCTAGRSVDAPPPPAVAWHVAPVAVHRPVCRNGLLPGAQRFVWLLDCERAARRRLERAAGSLKGAEGVELWRVDAEGLELIPRKGEPHVWVSRAAIPPTRLRMVQRLAGNPTHATRRLLDRGHRWHHHIHGGRVATWEARG